MNRAVTFCLIALLAIVQSNRAAFASDPIPTPAPREQSLPAVDGINAKFSIDRDISGHDIWSGAGSVAVPLGHRFGLQLDAGVSNFRTRVYGNIPVYSGAMHLFWRDPENAMLGLYGHTTFIDEFGGLSYHAAGLEFAKYWERITLEGVAGVTDGDYVSADFFSNVSLGYYLTDNLRVDVGHSYGRWNHAFLFGGEWAFGGHKGSTGAVYLDGTVQEWGATTAQLGLRFYFGQKQKSLLRRHREDDPMIPIPPILLSIMPGGINLYFLELPEIHFDPQAFLNILNLPPKRALLCLRYAC